MERPPDDLGAGLLHFGHAPIVDGRQKSQHLPVVSRTTDRRWLLIEAIQAVFQSDPTFQNQNDVIFYATELLEYGDKITDRELKRRGER
jgi:hypothetical protein